MMPKENSLFLSHRLPTVWLGSESLRAWSTSTQHIETEWALHGYFVGCYFHTIIHTTCICTSGTCIYNFVCTRFCTYENNQLFYEVPTVHVNSWY